MLNTNTAEYFRATNKIKVNVDAHIDSFCAEFKTVAYASQAAPNGGYRTTTLPAIIT